MLQVLHTKEVMFSFASDWWFRPSVSRISKTYWTGLNEILWKDAFWPKVEPAPSPFYYFLIFVVTFPDIYGGFSCGFAYNREVAKELLLEEICVLLFLPRGKNHIVDFQT